MSLRKLSSVDTFDFWGFLSSPLLAFSFLATALHLFSFACSEVTSICLKPAHTVTPGSFLHMQHRLSLSLFLPPLFSVFLHSIHTLNSSRSPLGAESGTFKQVREMKRLTAQARLVCPCARRHYSCLPNCQPESKGPSERHETERDTHPMLNRCREGTGRKEGGVTDSERRRGGTLSIKFKPQ